MPSTERARLVSEIVQAALRYEAALSGRINRATVYDVRTALDQVIECARALRHYDTTNERIVYEDGTEVER